VIGYLAMNEGRLSERILSRPPCDTGHTGPVTRLQAGHRTPGATLLMSLTTEKGPWLAGEARHDTEERLGMKAGKTPGRAGSRECRSPAISFRRGGMEGEGRCLTNSQH